MSARPARDNGMNSKSIHRIEILLLVLGLLLISIYLAAYIHRATMSRAGVSQFHELKKERQVETPSRSLAERQIKFDFSLWSPERIAGYEQSLAEKFDAPLAILHIAKVQLEVPVLDGVDDLSLNRGVGYIPGTSRPGEPGNIGIAGHRDGIFRVLKDVGAGDMIELETLDRVDIYRVSQIVIVDKNDPAVLKPTTASILTLVTCYPFYFIGSAPKRYIVQAQLVTSGLPASNTPRQGTSSASLEPAAQHVNPKPQKSTKEITQ
jgi:sortase A